jgi:adenylate cyclase
MRIRNKLLLAISVPVGLLIVQIGLVNVFIRELQSAVEFISSAHTVIESDFVAAELVSSMRKEVKLLPSRYVKSADEKGEIVPTLRPQWNELTSLINSISNSKVSQTVNPDALGAVIKAFDDTNEEYTKTEVVITSNLTDLDTLLERAIFVDKTLGKLQASLNTLAVELRRQLKIAIDRERRIHNRPVIAGIFMGSLAVLLLLAFTWLIVDRYFVSRLVVLSKSMLAIAGGNLRAALPVETSNDEVTEMARALTVFRDTAVEVEENNLRDIAEARQRLVDAIESISEGFSLYDKNDRLVLSNRRYQDLLYPEMPDSIEPGTSFSTIIENAARSGLVEDAIGRADEWIVERLERHRNPTGTFVMRRSDESWIEVTEYKTSDDDTVGIYADITNQKKSEMALLKAKNRAEEANEQVTQKNMMLESLSAKLSKYLSPQIYSSIFSGRQAVEIASKRKKLTVMFSDIAGFTETADGLESEELTKILNHYLTEMSHIALEYGATIDKYIGDAIMIFFGDPETKGVKADALACVKMAIEMQRRMRGLQLEWREQGMENPFQLRIGINTGYCTVGNFGSEDRMDYTIIGNEVNLAARLQTLAKMGEILISHETCSLISDTLLADEQPPTTVKGFSKPIRNYQIIGQYNEFVDEDRIIHVNENGVRVTVDLDNLTDLDKASTMETIEKILSKLKGNT